MANSGNFRRNNSVEAPPILDDAQYRMTLSRSLGSLLVPNGQYGTYFSPIRDGELGPRIDRSSAEITPEGIKELPISAKSIKKIMDFEAEVYKPHPEWPGEQSGITIGYGYDLGYYTRDKFREDWSPYLDEKALSRLESVMGSGKKGITGLKAKKLLSSVADIKIPKEAALEVFLKRTLPEFTERTLKAYPGAEKLPPDSLGALVSNTLNRGDATFSKDVIVNKKLREKKLVKEALAAGAIETIPGLLEASKWVWEKQRRELSDGTVDLENSANYGRRIKEARLFQEGLDQMKSESNRP